MCMPGITFKVHCRILHRTGSNGAWRLLWDALSLSTSSRPYLGVEPMSLVQVQLSGVFQDGVMRALHTGQYGV